MNLNDRVIAVIGLGYVGLPLAIEYGKKYRVIGFDIYQARVDELNRGEDHTLEADLVGMKQARDAYESTKKIGLTFTCSVAKKSWEHLNPDFNYAVFIDGRDNQCYKP